MPTKTQGKKNTQTKLETTHQESQSQNETIKIPTIFALLYIVYSFPLNLNLDFGHLFYTLPVEVLGERQLNVYTHSDR